MKLTFLGATERITGSCYLLRDELSNLSFLVDCGSFQGEPGEDQLNSAPFPFEPSSINFVLLTHGHLDHCGRLPQLFRDGFKGKIYCTKATAELVALALKDAARHAGFEQQSLDVAKMDFVAIDESDSFALTRPFFREGGINIAALRSAHVLGSVSFQIHWLEPSGENKGIVFSGDLGNNGKDNCYLPLLSHRQAPTDTDYIVVESTYGDREPRPKEVTSFHGRLKAWRSIIEQHDRAGGGPIIIPCFALQRSQEVFFDLYCLFSELGNLWRLECDAPLAKEMTQIFLSELSRRQIKNPLEPLYRNKSLATILGVQTEDEVDKQLEQVWKLLIGEGVRATAKLQGNIVLVTGGGMCETGKVIGHISASRSDEQTLVVLTGYAPSHTLAGQLKAIMKAPETAKSQIRVGSEQFAKEEFKIKVRDLGMYYSAHADADGLLDFIFTPPFDRKPRRSATVFLTHGEDAQRLPLKDRILDRASRLLDMDRTVSRVELPSKKACFDLNAGRWVEDEVSETITSETALLHRLLGEQRETNRLLALILANQLKTGTANKTGARKGS